LQLNIVSISEAASLLEVHPETVKRLCRREVLPATKFGRSWLIKRIDLLRFAEHYQATPGRPRKTVLEGTA
jgi:excisionase family DNA binding protein